MRLASALATILFVPALTAPALAQTNARPFVLSARVVPQSAALGDPVEFHLTVTNAGLQPASFGVDGCPVHLTLDGEFTPLWACAEFWREITLQPGDLVTFGPQDHGGLRVDRYAYPLAPGAHHAELWVPDIGRDHAVAVRFQVGPPDPELAYLAGRLTEADGYPVWGGHVVLHGQGPDGGWPPDSSDVPPGETHEIKVGESGYWLAGGIRPGTFYIEGRAPDGRSVFYGPDAAGQIQPVTVGPGEYRDGLDMVFQPGPPPPPPPPAYGRIFGWVVEDSFTDGPPVPIPGAVVRAIPVGSDIAVGDSIPPDGLFYDPFGYLIIAGDDGRFHMEVPPGAYILVAGHAGYRYRYWDLKDTWNEADATIVYPGDTAPPEVLHTLRLWPDLLGDPAVIRGQVMGHDPQGEMPVHPIPGALVRFHALVGGFERMLLQTETDENGLYEFTANPATPYFVEAMAPGYRGGFHGPDPYLPAGVDVRPGEPTEHVDFLLPVDRGPGEQGAIAGFVYERSPDCDAANGCLVPAAGATVRVEAAFPTFAPYIRTAIVARDGSFRVDGLVSDVEGSYSFYVSALRRNTEAFYYPGGVPYDQAVPLPVHTGQVSDAGRIVMGHGDPPPHLGVIVGRLVDTADHGVPHGLVKLFLDPDASDGKVLTVNTDAEGGFVFDRLPLGPTFVLAGAGEGFVPSYHPGVPYWRGAERVGAAGPTAFAAPVVWTLHRQPEGPYIQAGRVQVAEGAVDDSAWAEPASADPGVLALAHHRRNVPHALFYVVNALALSPMDIPVAGGFTGDNGTAILTELPEGTYLAVADRPGFETGVFRDGAGNPRLITLGPSTPAVLAEIGLTPTGWVGPPGADTRDGMVTGLQNAPNPFSPETTIRFTLTSEAAVCVEVFDFQGRLVRTLLALQNRPPGDHAVPWDGKNARGQAVTAGVYFYRVQAGPEVTSRKMVLLPR